MVEKEINRFECTIYILLCHRMDCVKYVGCDVGVQEGNIRKTMAARGLVNGRGPRSGRDLVFRCYPSELLSPPPKKTEADLLSQPFIIEYHQEILTGSD